MTFKFRDVFTKNHKKTNLTILLATCTPDPGVIHFLDQEQDLTVREAFTTRGVLQSLPGVGLVILGEVHSLPDTSCEILQQTFDISGIPTVSQSDFLADPAEWLGRARLANPRHITYLPPRQINLINWSGGVGKTTLAMSICKRFVQHTGLPVALLELSLGGSALHARVSPDLPEFFAIVTQKAEPARWQGVDLYPMDGRSIEVLWNEEPDEVRQLLAEIRSKHTLFVADCFPGHPLFAELSKGNPRLINMIVTSPRDDAMMQARRLINEVSEPSHLVLNMTKSLADRTETGVSVVLPYNETWAKSSDPHLADPILELVYKGWR